jgi:hypothetical protein
VERRAGSDISSRSLWSSVGVAAAAGVLLIVVAGVYANAIVSAGDEGFRTDCGTVWEPAASTSACADALKARSWTAIGLAGVALLGATGAVLALGRSNDGHRRRVAVVAAVTALAVVLAGFGRAGVIDRTMGS